MKILCHTNLDNYNCKQHFPELQFVPRKGEYIAVKNNFHDYFLEKHLPLRLEVVAVTYYEDHVDVELWYNKIDFDLYKQSGHELL